MTGDIEKAEQDVAAGLKRLTADMSNLKGLLQNHMVWRSHQAFKAVSSEMKEPGGGLSRKWLSFFRKNPVPSILIATGLGWLVGQHILGVKPRKTGGAP